MAAFTAFAGANQKARRKAAWLMLQDGSRRTRNHEKRAADIAAPTPPAPLPASYVRQVDPRKPADHAQTLKASPVFEVVWRASKRRPSAHGKASRVVKSVAPVTSTPCQTCPTSTCDARFHNIGTRRLTDARRTTCSPRENGLGQWAQGAQKPSTAFKIANPRRFEEVACEHEHVGDECLIPQFAF